ncbi:RraA family protein [Mesorhizobium sp. M0203]|uniref:RraA family protein n=1 Tax=Mesorhizobium sp. M0203 TaxID=2956912 RepID=UPI00333A8F53
MTDITGRLGRCYTGVVHDVMRAMGFRDFTFPTELRPLDPAGVICGPAFTVEGEASPTDAHETLLAWTGLLSKAPAGHVWVSQPNDRIVAHMGELSAETLKNKGVLGCVADGFIRDTNFLLEIGFPSWSRGYTPRDIVGHWLPKSVNIEIRIGDVTVAPGDYVLGDRDGLLRIPKASVSEVLEKAETAIATENLVRKAILAGVDPQEAYLQHGKF